MLLVNIIHSTILFGQVFWFVVGWFHQAMEMKAADQSLPPIDPQPDEDPEEQGLRILARFIARRLGKSRREEYARGYDRSEDDATASVSTDEDLS